MSSHLPKTETRPILSFEEITISHTFNDGSGRSIQIEPPTLSNPVDAVVISDIEWKGNPTDTRIYLLWSNITENSDANFWANIQESTAIISNSFVSFPKSQIIPINSLPKMLEFMLIDHRGRRPKVIEGEITIHLAFISYKKNH